MAKVTHNADTHAILIENAASEFEASVLTIQTTASSDMTDAKPDRGLT